MHDELFPDHPAGWTGERLTRLIAATHPGTVVDTVRVVQSSSFGEEMVSTASRALLSLVYRHNPADLPERAVLKLPREAGNALAPIYVNETRLYQQLGRTLRDDVGVEMPRLLGATAHAQSARYALLLEDLDTRQARFPNVRDDVDLAHVHQVLDVLARMHARYWDSPLFSDGLAWVETHLSGGVCQLMNEIVPYSIDADLAVHRYKRELLQRLRTTPARLLAATRAAQRHQASLPQTLLHGDTHLGNTYRLPDGRAGLVDWQLSVRGHALHDVGYIIATALDIELRREHEGELLRHYLDRLTVYGVARPPSSSDTWREYRRAMVWSLYIGWLTVPVTNYGWEINVLNLHRLTQAYEDLDTEALVRAMLA